MCLKLGRFYKINSPKMNRRAEVRDGKFITPIKVIEPVVPLTREIPVRTLRRVRLMLFIALPKYR